MRRIPLMVMLAVPAVAAAVLLGPIHHGGGGWGYDRCAAAQDQGASRDLLIGHGCHLNIFSGSVEQDGG